VNAIASTNGSHVSVTVKLTDEDVEFLANFRRMYPNEPALLTAIGDAEDGGTVPIVLFLTVDPA
jgi:hypothetical protein